VCMVKLCYLLTMRAIPERLTDASGGGATQIDYTYTFNQCWPPMFQDARVQGLKWVRTHGNAIPRSAICAVWRSQASKSAFFRRMARSPAGKIFVSMGTEGPAPQYSSLERVIPLRLAVSHYYASAPIGWRH